MFIIQSYRRKFEKRKKKRDLSQDFKTDGDVAHYSIMIHNLPTNQSPQALQDKITEVLKEVFALGPEEQPFVKVRVVGDYEKLYNLCVRLKRNIEKLRVAHKKNDFYR